MSVCEQAGARSLSDLARSAVQRLIADGDRRHSDDQLADKMHRLEKLISKVTEQLQLLNGGNGQEKAGDDMVGNGARHSLEPESCDKNGRGDE